MFVANPARPAARIGGLGLRQGLRADDELVQERALLPRELLGPASAAPGGRVEQVVALEDEVEQEPALERQAGGEEKLLLLLRSLPADGHVHGRARETLFEPRRDDLRVGHEPADEERVSQAVDVGALAVWLVAESVAIGLEVEGDRRPGEMPDAGQVLVRLALLVDAGHPVIAQMPARERVEAVDVRDQAREPGELEREPHGEERGVGHEEAHERATAHAR